MHKTKVLLFVLIIFTLLLSLIPSVYADTAVSANVMVNNLMVSGNVPAVYYNNVVLMPAKELVGALGGSFKYDNSKLTGTISSGENELVFRLDDSTAKFNGKYITAPAPLKIINNRLMVPVEFVSRQFGAYTCTNTLKKILMVFQPVNGNIVYKVVKGDTLGVTAYVFGTSVSSIEQLNGLTSDMIYIGQNLTVRNYTAAVTSITAAVTGGATLRSGAGFDSSAVNYLSTGASISVVGKSGDWFKVITPKGNGYLYYTVVGIAQDVPDNAANSTYFKGSVPIDTSMDTIMYNPYTVVKGDYMWIVAQRYGIPDYELAAANNLDRTSTLYPGQILNIPVHNVPVKITPGSQYGEVLDWFKEAQYVFPIGSIGKLTDMQTGKSFMIERTMGANHSDTETLTAADTSIMKNIFGGNWSWNSRPFILDYNGRHFAVSVAGMPHAGVDGAPFLSNVDNRSDNWGAGPNYDEISGNGMDGHFDMYFLNSMTHNTSQYDASHQYNVLVAGGLQ
ncbi:MAG: LysM peptidoglycan-binding domain-containing protein [Bacillota bacterium]|nr:LysM peptidoglycan-binding domain-containing protein [Bacillota bacterium]